MKRVNVCKSQVIQQIIWLDFSQFSSLVNNRRAYKRGKFLLWLQLRPLRFTAAVQMFQRYFNKHTGDTRYYERSKMTFEHCWYVHEWIHMMFARKMYADANVSRKRAAELCERAVMRVSIFGYCLELRSNVKYIQCGGYSM